MKETALELEVFAGQEKIELSMIEVARAILEERGRDKEMFFSDLVNAIQVYLAKSDADIREALPYFYADLNTDGSFMPLGENKWGLRSWYAVDEIDEEIITLEENDDEDVPKRKKQRVNAFLGDDEDAIDYNNDDPEDDTFRRDEMDMSYDSDNGDDEESEVESYDSELNEIDIDASLDEDETVGLDDEEDDYSDDELADQDA